MCGCKIVPYHHGTSVIPSISGKGKTKNVAIEFCPLHKAAGELLPFVLRHSLDKTLAKARELQAEIEKGVE